MVMSLTAPFEYPYPSAAISASIGKLLTSTTYKKMLETNSLKDALELLHQTTYNIIPTELEINENFGLMLDKIINQEIEHKIKHIIQASPKKTKLFLNHIIEQKENETLKYVLRALIMRVDKNYSLTKIAPFGRITYQVCQNIINNNSIEKALENIKNISLRKELNSVITIKINDKTVFEIDTIFEKHHIKKIKKELKNLKGIDKDKMTVLLGFEADIRNLINYFRAINLGLTPNETKHHRIPFHRHLSEENLNNISESGDLLKAQTSIPEIYKFITIGITDSEENFLSSFELYCKKYLASIYHNFFAGYRMNTGLIWAYIKLLLFEISDIRSILIGKMYNIQQSEIEKKIILYRFI